MTNYFTEFASHIECPQPAVAIASYSALCVAFADRCEADNEDHPHPIFGEDWVGGDPHIIHDDTGISIDDNGELDIDAAIRLVQWLQRNHAAQSPFVFTYASTCDKARAGGSSGGTVYVAGKIVVYLGSHQQFELVHTMATALGAD